MATLADLMVKIGADVGGFVGGMGKASKATVQFENDLYTAGRKASDIGRGMTLGLTLPLVGAGTMAIKTASEFQKSMNTMGAVADVPAAAMEELSALAMQLGQDTVFSSNEAAAAMLELAKGGIEPAQIQAGALATTLDMAAAADMDLAEAANVLASSMNTFKLEGEDAVTISDALAGAANASIADIEDMALAMQAGASSASRFGFTIEETSAVLAMLADAGIRGSDAGTLLKSQLRTIVPVAERTRKKMKELGIDFFDTQGNFIGLTAMAEELNNELGHLTQEQREAALAQIFGADASRLAGKFALEGAAGMRKYLEATAESGAASKVAEAKMKGLPGVLEQFAGSLETASLAAGKSLAPAVEFVANSIKTLVDAFSGLPGPVQTVIVTLLGVTAAAGPLLWIGGKLAMSFATMIGPIGRFVSATLQMQAAAALGGEKLGTLSAAAQTAKMKLGALGSMALGGGLAVGLMTLGPIIGDFANDMMGLNTTQREIEIGTRALSKAFREGEYDIRAWQAAIAAGELESMPEQVQEVVNAAIDLTHASAKASPTLINQAYASDQARFAMSKLRGELNVTANATASFAGMNKKEYNDWRAKSVSNFNMVKGGLDKLANKHSVTASKILDSMRKAMSAQIDFGKNWNTVVNRAGKRGEHFVAWIQENYGAKAPAFVEALADANQKEFNEIIKTWNKAERNAATTSNKTGKAFNEIARGAEGATRKTREEVSKVPGIVSDQEGPARSAGNSVGSAIGEGVATGIRSSVGQIAQEAANAVNEAERSARNAADAKSPSRKMMRLGEDLGMGLLLGMTKHQRAINNALSVDADIDGGFSAGRELVGAMASQGPSESAASERPNIQATFITRGKADKKFAKDALREMDWAARTEPFHGS